MGDGEVQRVSLESISKELVQIPIVEVESYPPGSTSKKEMMS